jgi:hypothetical protein
MLLKRNEELEKRLKEVQERERIERLERENEVKRKKKERELRKQVAPFGCSRNPSFQSFQPCFPQEYYEAYYTTLFTYSHTFQFHNRQKNLTGQFISKQNQTRNPNHLSESATLSPNPQHSPHTSPSSQPQLVTPPQPYQSYQQFNWSFSSSFSHSSSFSSLSHTTSS